jgi:FkbM family methyltransferase
MTERWKSRVAQCFVPFIPLVRALLRYGPLKVRTAIWQQIGHTRLVGLPHHFTVGTEYGSFTGDSSDMLAKYIYYFGQWEPEVSHLIKQRLRPGQTFVDVGANSGWYTLLAANAVGPTGRVIAIEASPTTFDQLKDNIDNNGLRNVRLVNEAVWSSQSLLPLFQGPPSHSVISTVMSSFAERRRCAAAGQIRARPLSEILDASEIATLRILKIDVEGAEQEVIRGFEPVLDSVPDDLEIFLELNPADYDAAGLLSSLRQRGFRAWIIPNRYETDCYVNYSARQPAGQLEELVEMPKEQIDVLVSRTPPSRATD